MLEALDRRITSHLDAIEPWDRSYALARSVVALGTLSTLLATPTTSLFLPSAGQSSYPYCSDIARFGAFCLLPGHLPLTQWVAIAILGFTAAGLWPRIFGLLHFWVSFSLQANATMTDGGDQIASILTLLLLPCTLLDTRWNHWSRMSDRDRLGAHGTLIAYSSRLVLRMQVGIVYLHAAIGKTRSPEWLDGTAMYYWVVDPQFGASAQVRAFLLPIIQSAAVAPLTWSVLLIEFAIGIGAILSGRVRNYLMWVGFGLHFCIAFVHGLPSFSLSMVGALLLYGGRTARCREPSRGRTPVLVPAGE